MLLWSNNVLGNHSKQYNKHMNVLGMNSNLPGKLLNQEFFQHFISTLQHALSSEQFSAILEIVKCVLFLSFFHDVCSSLLQRH
jgi:hypothetical protein